MTPRERFVHFVATFAAPDSRDELVEEALRIDVRILTAYHPTGDGDLEPPVIERPMDAAWEFVQHRRFGATRPYWYPAIVAPESKLIR